MKDCIQAMLQGLLHSDTEFETSPAPCCNFHELRMQPCNKMKHTLQTNLLQPCCDCAAQLATATMTSQVNHHP